MIMFSIKKIETEKPSMVFISITRKRLKSPLYLAHLERNISAPALTKTLRYDL